MADESIYNLIPDAYEAPPKGKMYRSKHSANVAPSYSTFPRKETRSDRDASGAILYAGRSGVIGRDVGAEVDPKRFLKKSDQTLPPVDHNFHRTASPTQRKEPIPPRSAKPVMGLMTDKNFVHANAVDAICMVSKKPKSAEPLAVTKTDFGKAPKYLTRVKGQLEAEKEMVQNLHHQEEEYNSAVKAQYVRQMPDGERVNLVAALRERWEEKHKQYQSLPFAQDTAMQIQRKETIEREMKEIETALEKLNKKVLFVYRDTEPHVARYAKAQAEQEAQRAAMTYVKAATL